MVAPPPDIRSNDYNTAYIINATHVEFISDRNLSTGDIQDFNVTLVSFFISKFLTIEYRIKAFL
jgi:hypothetical protein